MKAILVIDMPSKCFACPLHSLSIDEPYCNIVRDTAFGVEKPSWCPLRPMPDNAVEMLLEGLDKIENLKNVKVSYVNDLMGETE